MTDGDAGMTRDELEALIGRMLDAEARTTPPPAGEEGDWLYGSAGFTEPDEHGWMAPLASAHVWSSRELVFWHVVVQTGAPVNGEQLANPAPRWRAGRRSRWRCAACMRHKARQLTIDRGLLVPGAR